MERVKFAIREMEGNERVESEVELMEMLRKEKRMVASVVLMSVEGMCQSSNMYVRQQSGDSYASFWKNTIPTHPFLLIERISS